MGRKKWDLLSDEKKDKIMLDIQKKMMKLTEMKETVDEEYDFFDALNDEIKDTFECNMKCMDCTVEDLKKCVMNFRQANIIWIKKIATYEEMVPSTLQLLLDFVEGFMETIRTIVLSDEDEEKEKEKKPQDNSHALYA